MLTKKKIQVKFVHNCEEYRCYSVTSLDPAGELGPGGQKKRRNTLRIKTPSLCARIAFRFFLCAFINFAAFKTAIDPASHTPYDRHRGVHIYRLL